MRAPAWRVDSYAVTYIRSRTSGRGGGVEVGRGRGEIGRPRVKRGCLADKFLRFRLFISGPPFLSI